MSAPATAQQATPGADHYPASVKDMLTSGLARACHYAAGRPDCQVRAEHGSFALLPLLHLLDDLLHF